MQTVTNISIRRDKIICSDHAGDKVACAMLTALTVSLVDNLINRLNDKVDCTLDKGLFVLNFERNRISPASNVLIDSYIYSLHKLTESYPDNFKIDM